MKRKIFSLLLIAFAHKGFAGNKILYYFNRPVDNSVSTTMNAVYLNNCVADTFVAYINRAKYTIDIAQYDYNQGSFANIATAINNAYSRGVVVRWIYDGSSSNTGLTALNSGIHTLGSPTSNSYGIMHNKYVVIDANSTNADDAIVWTGSFDWSTSQFNTAPNNAVVLQDQPIAHAFTDEFNMMWGGTAAAPDASHSKFGPDKTDLGSHSFTIEGKQVELYFSPSDGTNTHIQSAIQSANTDLYFGMYTFTDNNDATAIVDKHNSGVYVAGIDDSYSNSYQPYSIFSSGLGNNFKVYSSPGIYHNKFLIVDPSNKCSDPLVLTGSHNWTLSANTKNDENTIIIHSDTAANVYYQSFHANFASLGGTLTTVNGCPTSVNEAVTVNEGMNVYPSPSNGDVTISYELAAPQTVNILVYTVTGQLVMMPDHNDVMQQQGKHNYQLHINEPGMYVIHVVTEKGSYTKRVFVTGR